MSAPTYRDHRGQRGTHRGSHHGGFDERRRRDDSRSRERDDFGGKNNLRISNIK